MKTRSLLAIAGIGGVLLVGVAPPAGADGIGAGSASAYGAAIEAGGQGVVPPTPEASVVAPPGNNVSETLVDVPAEPVALSGTLTATARVHGPSDIPSALTVESQAVAGPYNAQGVALIEGLDVLLDTPTEGVSLLSADVIRAEAVAVCTAGAVQYSANSEIIDLQIAGEAIPLNAPLQDIIDAISGLLADTGLNQVVDVQRNVVSQSDGGVSVDALVVTVLAAAGDDPLAEVVIGHAEVTGAACGSMPQCSDGSDNDGDGSIDFPNDPQCDSAEDPSEFPECSDGIDNDGDGFIDFPNDPGCDDPADDDEVDTAVAPPATTAPVPEDRTLARTGGDGGLPAIALALTALAVVALAARRRLV